MELIGMGEVSCLLPPCYPKAIVSPRIFPATGGLGGRPALLAPAEGLVVAMVGLAFEARIAAGPGVVVICRDTESGLLAAFNHALRRGCRSIISFGVAGGLAPHLRPGDRIIASSVIDGHHIQPTDHSWTEKLLAIMPGANHAPILGVDAAVTDPAVKRRMHANTGAVTVDIESHLVARLAAAHGLSFTAVRVVIDPAHRAVPESAMAGMRPGGGTSIMAVLRKLIARPSDLSGLLCLAVDAYAARNTLLRVRRMLGPSFGLVGIGEV